MLKPAIEVGNGSVRTRMELTPGICVRPAAQLAQAGRLMISSGAQTAAAAGLADAYVMSAWVPRVPWSSLTKAQVGILVAGGDASPPGVTVEILSPSGREAQIAARKTIALGTHLLTGHPDATNQFTSDVIDAACDLIGALTESTTRRFCYASALHLVMNRPGLLTTTRDPSQGDRLLGLHVDSHERMPLSERALSRRLLTVNLTPEPRALLFVHLSIAQVYDVMRAVDPSFSRATNDATGLARAFLAVVQSYPVLRLVLGPGEACLAPVQNMIHDGCTECRTHTDLTARAFGEYEEADIKRLLPTESGETSWGRKPTAVK